jgi:glutaminyl-tRNA synthetase
MGVLEPLKVVLTNCTEEMQLEGPWHPQNAELGSRQLPFSRELFIEQADFSQDPPGKWKRLSPGQMVRLRYAYIIRCDEVEYDAEGNVAQLNCTYFPDSKSGEDTSGLKPKGVVHWVDAKQSVAVEVRDYDRLFNVPNPSSKTFIDDINQNSLRTLHARIEPGIIALEDQHFQFERQGYFCKDSELPGVFNKTVSLREGF